MMSPENYRFIEKTSRALVDRINLYIAGGTVDGLINPMVFLDEIKHLSDEISEAIGICTIATKNTKTLSIKHKYQMLLDELCECRDRLYRECVDRK